jgi:hypothetical protein
MDAAVDIRKVASMWQREAPCGSMEMTSSRTGLGKKTTTGCCDGLRSRSYNHNFAGAPIVGAPPAGAWAAAVAAFPSRDRDLMHANESTQQGVVVVGRWVPGVM